MEFIGVVSPSTKGPVNREYCVKVLEEHRKEFMASSWLECTPSTFYMDATCLFG